MTAAANVWSFKPMFLSVVHHGRPALSPPAFTIVIAKKLQSLLAIAVLAARRQGYHGAPLPLIVAEMVFRLFPNLSQHTRHTLQND